MATLDRINVDNDLTILKLKGSLDAQGLQKVEKPFESATQEPGARVVVDLTGVDMVTTPAISMFLEAANLAKDGGGRVVFTEAQPPVNDVLKRLRLHQILRTVPGLEKAIDEARH